MANVKTFRDLIAWQKAMNLAVAVYEETDAMPDGERYGLTRQLRRAAVSVPSNIAEGFGRRSTIDLLKFLRIARGSLNELDTQFELVDRLGMLTCNERITAMVNETDRVLQGLINSLLSRLQRNSSTP